MSVEDVLAMALHPGVRRDCGQETFLRHELDPGHDIPVPVAFVDGLRPVLARYGLESCFHLVLFAVIESAYSREVTPIVGSHPSVVAAEPFSGWTLLGELPTGRPAWKTSGARFIDDIAPYEERVPGLLNGAHTILASLGRLRGRRTVAAAVADPACRRVVERALGPSRAALALLDAVALSWRPTRSPPNRCCATPESSRRRRRRGGRSRIRVDKKRDRSLT